MAGTKTRYFCTSCGGETLKWEGRCPACGEWNSLAEAPEPKGRSSGGRASSGDPGGRRGTAVGRSPAPLREAGGRSVPRTRVDLGDLDRVLGGGIVPGSVVLVGGAPGIGKSTLLLQISARLSKVGASVLYASGEESAAQVGLRAERLGDGAEDVVFVAETDVEALVRTARQLEPDLLCVDSIQTLHSPRLDSAPGTVSQVRECAAVLQEYAKDSDTPVFLVGHVTKTGGLAGPRTLEHVVDVVVLFQGERSLEHRILRTLKNRFGGVDELAVFRMTSGGLIPVAHPSRMFLADRPEDVSGSTVAVPLHGTRPVLAEVQALTAPGRYGSPQRVATGVDSRRLAMLLAVLERRVGVSLGESDVFVNVVGGLRLEDPAADLAVLAALLSAELDVPVPRGLAFLGEVGLGGEVRGVAQPERRLREVERTGLRGVVLAAGDGKGARTGLTTRPLERVGELRSILEESAGEERR